jgi:hypothetical protein
MYIGEYYCWTKDMYAVGVCLPRQKRHGLGQSEEGCSGAENPKWIFRKVRVEDGTEGCSGAEISNR